MSEDTLYSRVVEWVTQNYSNAEHLVKTEAWLLELQPEAPLTLRLAALTHDMERAFPGPDSPKALSGVDHAYNRAHSERSATIVDAFLREQGAEDRLREDVMVLIRAHEYGGWPQADLLQAADSLSFLEVNIPLFLRSIGGDQEKWEQVRVKFVWMYERIQIERARLLAGPLYASALERLNQEVPKK